MAARRFSYVKLEKNSRSFTEALGGAIYEWILIFFLFINGLFSFLITKFARYCGLQPPCVLCSRLDHVFSNDKLGSYWDMMCGNHKKEISSLVTCHAHNKLVNVQGMCENCLFSFATINKSNAETYRLLVGKLGEDSGSRLYEGSYSGDHKAASSSMKHCVCCHEPWNLKAYAQKLAMTKSSELDVDNLDLRLPRVIVLGHNSQNIKDRRSCQSNYVVDPLSHVRYTELKITSESDSDLPTSDDDETVSQASKSAALLGDSIADYSQVEAPVVSFSDNPTSSNPIDPSVVSPHTGTGSNAQLEDGKSHGSTSEASDDECDLEESNNNKSRAPDINVVSSSQEEFISFDDVIPATNDAASPSNIISENSATKNEETGKTFVVESEKGFEPENHPAASTEKSIKFNGSSLEGSNQVSNTLELGDAYKLAVGSRGKLTDVLTEQWLSKDSSRLSEDLKNLFSQFSAPRGFEQSPHDLSPKLSLDGNELKTSEASNSAGLQILQKRISLERNESGLSMEGSIVSEIEGESVIDRLKRQIEHDRKSMSTLYKELEEERNASAIAANQAMAMITRLQEEKATLHMEALQYLRMMEEQAEYDMEALQKSNDLISEKDKEIQDLEAELEFYRNNFSNDDENFESPLSRMRNSPCKPEHMDIQPDETSSGALRNLEMDIEDERLQISQCLKNLEEKLGLWSCSEIDIKSAYREHSGKEDSEAHIDVELDGHREAAEAGELSLENDASPIDVSSSFTGQQQQDSSLENPPSVSRRNGDTENTGKKWSEGTDLASLRNEVAYLHEKLEALEGDRKLLVRATSLVRSGDEGLKFIRDIASQFRELRNSRIRKERNVA